MLLGEDTDRRTKCLINRFYNDLNGSAVRTQLSIIFLMDARMDNDDNAKDMVGNVVVSVSRGPATC